MTVNLRSGAQSRGPVYRQSGKMLVKLNYFFLIYIQSRVVLTFRFTLPASSLT